MPHGKRRSKKEIMELKEKIFTYTGQGLSDREIWKLLKLPRSTYFRYLDDANKEMNKHFFQKSERIVSAFVSREIARIQEAMFRYNKAKKDGLPEQTKWFELAEQIDIRFIEKLQQLGVISKAAEKFKHEIIEGNPILALKAAFHREVLGIGRKEKNDAGRGKEKA